jgi:hypothetical protein
MEETAIKNIIQECYYVDKSNKEMCAEIEALQNHGGTEFKKKVEEAELKAEMENRHKTLWESARIEIISKQLGEEERKCKEVMDKGITAVHKKEEVDEDADAERKKMLDHREEIIAQQVKLSQIKKAYDRSNKDHKKLDEENA